MKQLQAMRNEESNVGFGEVRKPGFLTVFVSLMLAALCSCGSGSGYGGSPTGPGPTKELNSGNIAAGASYQHRFASAGTYRYHCNYHGVMTGTVQVSTSDLDTLVTVSIVSSSSPFPGASVKPGGRVRWVNNTGMIHTVTSN